ncbi:MAG: aminoglycoside adenylyltransferase domain-containing protein [Dermatophilaceae bacterium]
MNRCSFYARAHRHSCATLAYLEDGLIVSKVAAGVWGIARLPQHQGLIARALEEQRCGLPSRDAGAEARELVTAVLGELRTATTNRPSIADGRPNPRTHLGGVTRALSSARPPSRRRIGLRAGQLVS